MNAWASSTQVKQALLKLWLRSSHTSNWIAPFRFRFRQGTKVHLHITSRIHDQKSPAKLSDCVRRMIAETTAAFFQARFTLASPILLLHSIAGNCLKIARVGAICCSLLYRGFGAVFSVERGRASHSLALQSTMNYDYRYLAHRLW